MCGVDTSQVLCKKYMPKVQQVLSENNASTIGVVCSGMCVREQQQKAEAVQKRWCRSLRASCVSLIGRGSFRRSDVVGGWG